METVAVIGSNSFSGSHFVDYLLQNSDYNILGISRSEENNPIFLPYKDKEKGRFKFFQKDLNKNLEEILDIIKSESVGKVVNFAAQGMVAESWENPLQWFQTNCLGVIGFTDKLRKIKEFNKYVQISSPEVYGSSNNLAEDAASYNPSTPYAASKAAGDMFLSAIARQFKFPVDIVRSTNVYGPGQQLFRIIPRSIIYLNLGKKIPLHGGGEAIKSYLHIKDVCDGIFRIMENKDQCEIYHLSPSQGYSIEGIVKRVCIQMEKDFEESVEIVGERLGQDAQYIINSDKARKKFNWKPKINIDEGLEECIQWVSKNWEVIKTLPLNYIHKE